MFRFFIYNIFGSLTKYNSAISGRFNLQNFLEPIAYIKPRKVVLCQTPEDVVNKKRNMINFDSQK